MKKDSKTRTFFVTVNIGATCYDNLTGIIEDQSNCQYAYITHDKDNDEETGQPKKEHIHIVLAYENPRDFETIQNHFPGAHIEKVQDLAKSVQYLTHKNDKTKYQYEFDDIITNDQDFFKAYYNQKDYPILNEQVILDLIVQANKENQGFKLSLPYFYLTYGNKQTKEYRQMIVDCLGNQSTLLKLQVRDELTK